LLVNANPDVVRDSPKKVMDFIKDATLRRFYMVELEKLLVDYAPGRPEMKPDVIAQTLELEKQREKMAADAAAAGGGAGGQIIIQQPGQQPVALNNQQVVQILQKLQADVEARDKEIAVLKAENVDLQRRLATAEAATTPAPAPAATPAAIPDTTNDGKFSEIILV